MMIDIVIVNWNSGNQLYLAVESVHKYHNGLVNSLVIVDNASVDHSVGLVESAFLNAGFQIKIIRNQANAGFGAACNQGAASCESPYLLFLNPDALMFEDTLDIVVEYMEKKENEKVGVCGVQLVDESGHVARSCAKFPMPLSLCIQSVGLNRLKFFHSYSLHMNDWDHLSTRTVDHVIGAFYFIRNTLFRELNGFDERFFVYLEDLDLSYRIHKAGFKSVYLAEARAFHEGGGVSNQIKARRLFYSLRSRLVYAWKHFNLIGALMVILLTLLIEPFIRTIFSVLQFSVSRLRETWIGYGMLYAWLPRWAFKGETRE